jgi:hypothetical protein
MSAAREIVRVGHDSLEGISGTGHGTYAWWMPQRSTPFQAIVRLVREHLARPGVTITESKFLRDAVLRIDREVDVVIEGEFDGERVVVSMEVNERGRRAGLPWVQEMIRKHRNLPTNRLILVSKAGFTSPALEQVATEAGRVQALTPQVVMRDGQPVVTRIYADRIEYGPTGSYLHVRSPADEQVLVKGDPWLPVCGSDGVVLGEVGHLVYEALRLEDMRRRFMVEAHHRPDKDQIRSFSAGLLFPQLGYYLRHPESGDLYLIEALEMWGNFAILQTEIPLTVTDLGGRIYGAAQVTINGRPAVCVGTTDEASQTTRISWQTTDGVIPPAVAAPSEPIRFAGLSMLVPTGGAGESRS